MVIPREVGLGLVQVGAGPWACSALAGFEMGPLARVRVWFGRGPLARAGTGAGARVGMLGKCMVLPREVVGHEASGRV